MWSNAYFGNFWGDTYFGSGSPAGGVGTPTVTVSVDGIERVVVDLQWVGPGSETAVLKVDVSTFASHPHTGAACTGVAIERIYYHITYGMVVDLLWHADVNVPITSLVYTGDFDCREIGPLDNDAGTGKTGDILLSTNGLISSTDRYSIRLVLIKVYAAV